MVRTVRYSISLLKFPLHSVDHRATSSLQTFNFITTETQDPKIAKVYVNTINVKVNEGKI